jgi:predicted adenylyl cyclase CyaB
MLEIEVKVRVKDLEALREALLKSGAELQKERYSEENTLYDFPSRTLFKKRSALRLRKAGKKTFLAFKGAPQKSRRFKVREEFETEVKNEKQAKKILGCLGLAPAFRYQKSRTVYKRGRLKICLDETEAGTFCEFEGERNKISKYAKILGFGRADLIKLDYVQLLQKKGKKP